MLWSKQNLFRPSRRENEGERNEEEEAAHFLSQKYLVFMEKGEGNPIIENSLCHCTLANLKIASDDGGSGRESGTLMNLRSERGLKGTALTHARPLFGAVRMTNPA